MTTQQSKSRRRKAALILASLALLIASALSASRVAAETPLCAKTSLSCPQLVFEGLTYPYPREDGSYLFIDGGVYPYVQVTDNLLGDSTVALPGGAVVKVTDLLTDMNLSDHAKATLVPVVGYGSNPAPSQLSRKFAKEILEESVVIPVMKGWIEGYDVVWTPFFTGYGALPSTLYPAPGVRADIWVNWLTEADVKRMDATEHLSSNWYVRADLSDAPYGFDGPLPKPMQLYVSCFGALEVDGKIQALASVPAQGRTGPAIDSVAALSIVQPTVAPDASVVGMVQQVVSDPDTRAAYTKALAPFRTFKEKGQFSKDACANGAN